MTARWSWLHGIAGIGNPLLAAFAGLPSAHGAAVVRLTAAASSRRGFLAALARAIRALRATTRRDPANGYGRRGRRRAQRPR